MLSFTKVAEWILIAPKLHFFPQKKSASNAVWYKKVCGNIKKKENGEAINRAACSLPFWPDRFITILVRCSSEEKK